MRHINIEETIIYEDKEILVCHKPAGLPVQSSKIGSPDMESALMNYIAAKGENPYVAVIHRLDQPVQGILVFAKNKKAAGELSRQMQSGKMEKYYLAVLCGHPKNKEGRLENELVKEPGTNMSRVSEKKTPKSKKAVLTYKILKEQEEYALAEIHLLTGRHHQIRVQMAYAGYPLLGDSKYNPDSVKSGEWKEIALCAYKLEFLHPTTMKKMRFEIKPSGNFPIV